MDTLNHNLPEISESEAAGLFLIDQAMAFCFQGALRAAAVLGIADQLVNGPKTADELATAVGADADRLHRILRLLTTRGIFREVGSRRYALTPAAEYLRSDVPHSFRAAVIWLTDEPMLRPVGNLVESVRGNSAFEHIYGMPYFEYWAQAQVSSGDFDEGMCSYSTLESSILARSYDFPKDATVADIGGGFGILLLNVLKINPTLHGILYDQEHVLAKNRLGELGDDSRFELVAGNFFESCPPADIYLLKYVIHDWDDKRATQILRCCRQAMAPGGKVLIMDPLIPAGNSWSTSKLADMIVMAACHDGGGTERTEEEYRELLGGAGLRLNRIIDTGTFVPIIEAVAD
ncbi:methyltransferase [Phyllobacterium phragmitis]|uniref:Methyltransferase n=1 Tax=Phyllobacterium phragmitis TaxID=2670329 RepID=A0A2S9IJD0_9HYPH|nr:methyltransferase [Phyllobacterium phragmitis]PRD40627.1 methyltransferase [Phyllobacterium phragmitis]